jgi:hypothetical protein
MRPGAHLDSALLYIRQRTVAPDRHDLIKNNALDRHPVRRSPNG